MPVPHDYDAEIKALQDEVAELQKQLEEQQKEQKQNAPYIGDNGNWYVNGEDTHVPAQGPKGEDGKDGTGGSDDPWYTPKWNPGTVSASVSIGSFSGTGVSISITGISISLTGLSISESIASTCETANKFDLFGVDGQIGGSRSKAKMNDNNLQLNKSDVSVSKENQNVLDLGFHLLSDNN